MARSRMTALSRSFLEWTISIPAKTTTHPSSVFGLSIIDAYKDIYQSQRQFVLRDSRPALLFTDAALSPIVEAVFGAFPQEAWAESFIKSYIEVFQPIIEDLDVSTLVSVFSEWRGGSVYADPLQDYIVSGWVE